MCDNLDNDCDGMVDEGDPEGAVGGPLDLHDRPKRERKDDLVATWSREVARDLESSGTGRLGPGLRGLTCWLRIAAG